MGTKKRRIRGGELIKRKFLSFNKFDNNISQSEYSDRAMRDINEAFANFLVLYNDYSENKDNKNVTDADKTKLKLRVNKFMTDMFTKFNEKNDKVILKNKFTDNFKYNDDKKNLLGSLDDEPIKTQINDMMTIYTENLLNKNLSTSNSSGNLNSSTSSGTSNSLNTPSGKEAVPTIVNSLIEKNQTQVEIDAEAERKRKEEEAEAERKRKEEEAEAERKRKEEEVDKDTTIFPDSQVKHTTLNDIIPTITLFGNKISVYYEGINNAFNELKKETEKEKNDEISKKDAAKKTAETAKQTAEDDIKTAETAIKTITSNYEKLENEIKEKELEIDKAKEFRKNQKKILQELIKKNPNITIGQAIDQNYSKEFRMAIYYCVNTHPKKPDKKAYYYVPSTTKLNSICDDANKDIGFKLIDSPGNIQKIFSLSNFQDDEYNKQMFSNQEFLTTQKWKREFNTLLTNLKDQINKLLSFGNKLNETNIKAVSGGFIDRMRQGADNMRQGVRSVSDEYKAVLQSLYDSYKNINLDDINDATISNAIKQLEKAVTVFEKIRIKSDKKLEFTGDLWNIKDNFIKGNILKIDDIRNLNYDAGTENPLGGGSRKRKNQKKSKTLRRK